MGILFPSLQIQYAKEYSLEVRGFVLGWHLFILKVHNLEVCFHLFTSLRNWPTLLYGGQSAVSQIFCLVAHFFFLTSHSAVMERGVVILKTTSQGFEGVCVRERVGHTRCVRVSAPSSVSLSAVLSLQCFTKDPLSVVWKNHLVQIWPFRCFVGFVVWLKPQIHWCWLYFCDRSPKMHVMPVCKNT